MVQVPGRHNTDLTKINEALGQIDQGRLNCSGTFTLAAGATTTTVPAATVGADTSIVFSPMTADAAAVLGTTFILASNISAGAFIVSHASAASVDRTFAWIGIG